MVCLVLFLATPVRAELQWEKKTVELNAKIGEKVLRASYRFTNAGKKTVSIVSISPGCGCLSPEVEKMNYSPGESGEIKVTFDLEMDDETGLLEKSIEVTTSDAPKAPALLRLRVHVPETVEISPRELIWERGAKPVAKEAVVRAGENIAAIKLTQSAANDDFGVEIKPIDAGRSFRVKVTPRSTAGSSYAQIELQVESTSFRRPENVELDVNVK